MSLSCFLAWFSRNNLDRLVQADADTSRNATVTAHNIVLVCIRILEARRSRLSRDKWGPHRTFECGEQSRGRTRLFVARRQFGKRHHRRRRPDRLEALRCSVDTGRRRALQGRQHQRYRLKISPSQRAPVQRQRGAQLSYTSLVTPKTHVTLAPRISRHLTG